MARVHFPVSYQHKKYFSFGEEGLLGFLRKLPKFNKFFFSRIAVKDGKQNLYLSISALHISLIFSGT